jgi:hypothetical protein
LVAFLKPRGKGFWLGLGKLDQAGRCTFDLTLCLLSVILRHLRCYMTEAVENLINGLVDQIDTWLRWQRICEGRFPIVVMVRFENFERQQRKVRFFHDRMVARCRDPSKYDYALICSVSAVRESRSGADFKTAKRRRPYFAGRPDVVYVEMFGVFRSR